MSYTLVTGIFDVKKRDPKFSKRTVDRYISLFNYILTLKCEVILFTESHIIDKIPETPGLRKICLQLEDLPIYKAISDSGVTDTPKNLPLLTNAYSAVINSKYYMLSLAKNYAKADVTHLIWIDAGVAHVGPISEKTFKEDILLHIKDAKIHLIMMNATFKSEILNLKEFLSYNREKIAAGLAIVPISEIDWLNDNLYKLYLSVLKGHKIICLEEQLLPVITLENPDKFSYIYSYYHILKNLRYITTDLNVILQNINNCRQADNTDLALGMLDHVISSILSGAIIPDIEQFCNIFYNAQILYYYKDTLTSRKYSIYIGWIYHHNESGKRWINSCKDNVKSNISFHGLNLDDPCLFTDEITADVDKDGIMWLIY